MGEVGDELDRACQMLGRTRAGVCSLTRWTQRLMCWWNPGATEVSRVQGIDLKVREARSLEEVRIEHHRQQTGCKCDFIVKQSSWPPMFTCIKCNEEI